MITFLMNEKSTVMIYSADLAKQLTDKIQKFAGEIKAVKSNGTFRVIASDDTVDRHGETIDVAGWKTDNYMKNPVVLFGHDYWTLENIVGRATKVYVENSKLIIEGEFADTENAQLARKLYDGGFLNAVSVGLLPLKRDENNYERITSAELLEVSFVPVPANPEALRLDKSVAEKMVKLGFLQKQEDLDEEDEEEIVEETVISEEEVTETEVKTSEVEEKGNKKEATLQDIYDAIMQLNNKFDDLKQAMVESAANGKASEDHALKNMLQALDKTIGARLSKMKV